MPPKYNDSTPVIFRASKNGDVIAIFPTIPPAGNSPSMCHAIARDRFCDITHHDVPLTLGQRMRLATRQEYMPLKKELQRMGYRLRVVSRISSHHNKQRREACKGHE